MFSATFLSCSVTVSIFETAPTAKFPRKSLSDGTRTTCLFNNSESIKINDIETSLCAIAERKMLETIGGDCETAIGGLAEITNNNLILKVQLFSDEGDESFDYKFAGRDVDAANIGKTVGEKLLNLAGKKFKRR